MRRLRTVTVLVMGGLVAHSSGASANPACDAPAIEIEDAPSVVQDWGRAVGRLHMFSGGWHAFCTATLISPNLAITAGHCFDPADTNYHYGNTPQEVCSNTTMQFEYELQEGVLDSGGPQFACDAILDTRFIPFPGVGDSIDVAIIRLDGNPGHEFGYRPLNYEFDFDSGETLTTINHRGGGSKKVSTTTSYDATTVNGNPILMHYADTEGGSSGATILDDDGWIVAVHSSELSEPQCKKHAYPLERFDMAADDGEDFVALEQVTWLQRSPVFGGHAGDRFGAAMVAGDFDGNGADDLVVQRSSGIFNQEGVGSLSIYRGTDDYGLDTKFVAQWQQSGSSSPETGDLYGSVLAAGDFDGDGHDDLVVGTPEEDWGATQARGMVQVIVGTPAGLVPSQQHVIQPSSWGFGDEIDMRFGGSLAVGDFDCDGYDDLAIGAPGLDGGFGRVFVASGGAATGGIPVADYSFDAIDVGTHQGGASPSFGHALAAGHLTGDPAAWASGCVDLAVGAPTDDAGAVAGAGAVSVVPGHVGGLGAVPAELLLSPAPQTFALYGWTLAVGKMFDYWGDYDSIAVGSPLASDFAPAAGRVDVRRGYFYGVDAYDWELTHAAAPGVLAESWDGFGTAMAFAAVNGTDVNVPLFATATSSDHHAGNAGALIGTAGWFGGSMGQPLEVDPTIGLYLSLNDGFGDVLVGGDFDGDGTQELAIGIPDVDRDTESSVGAVLIRTLAYCNTPDGTC